MMGLQWIFYGTNYSHSYSYHRKCMTLHYVYDANTMDICGSPCTRFAFIFFFQKKKKKIVNFSLFGISATERMCACVSIGTIHIRARDYQHMI